MKLRGTVAVVGDYISGDVILPARYAFLDPEAMADHVLEELDPTANARVRRAGILVAGTAFGYGTGRESSARALRAAGVKVVIGGPFARMFYRNAINNGLLVLDCPALVRDAVDDGCEIEIDTVSGDVVCAGRAYIRAAGTRSGQPHRGRGRPGGIWPNLSRRPCGGGRKCLKPA